MVLCSFLWDVPTWAIYLQLCCWSANRHKTLGLQDNKSHIKQSKPCFYDSVPTARGAESWKWSTAYIHCYFKPWNRLASCRLPTKVPLSQHSVVQCSSLVCLRVSENQFTKKQSLKSSDRAVTEVSRYADVKGGGGKGQGTTCQRAVV